MFLGGKGGLPLRFLQDYGLATSGLDKLCNQIPTLIPKARMQTPFSFGADNLEALL